MSEEKDRHPNYRMVAAEHMGKQRGRITGFFLLNKVSKGSTYILSVAQPISWQQAVDMPIKGVRECYNTFVVCDNHGDATAWLNEKFRTPSSRVYYDTMLKLYFVLRFPMSSPPAIDVKALEGRIMKPRKPLRKLAVNYDVLKSEFLKKGMVETGNFSPGFIDLPAGGHDRHWVSLPMISIVEYDSLLSKTCLSDYYDKKHAQELTDIGTKYIDQQDKLVELITEDLFYKKKWPIKWVRRSRYVSKGYWFDMILDEIGKLEGRVDEFAQYVIEVVKPLLSKPWLTVDHLIDPSFAFITRLPDELKDRKEYIVQGLYTAIRIMEAASYKREFGDEVWLKLNELIKEVHP